ncbi:MAG: cupin domain-containing protein [Deltaproteobacteria bacterium]|nr:cupin domain-containing protein [Nannocystaceae bacterium]
MDDITVKSIEEIAAYAGEHAIPGIRFRPAREALGVSSWGMNVLELDAHCTSYPEHDHASDSHEEVYLVLRGSVTLHAGGVVRTLGQGDFVRVGAATKRKFVTLEHGVVLLALGGTPGQPYAAAMGTPSR